MTLRKTLPLLLALAVGLPAPLPAQVRLPSLGDSVSEDFDVNTERRLGEQIMREVRRDLAYLDDPVLLEYVQSLWSPLVAAARRRGDIGADIATAFPWETFLVRDRSVNAFALPGGYVGVHLGLIAITSSRDELASVLAHELAHVSQRHIARSITASSRQSVVGLAAMVLGMLAASRAGNSGADVAQAAILGGQAAMLQGQLNFSRDMEREADRVGFGVLGQAGFAPSGVASMFEKMESAYRLNDSGNAYPYLRSHPLTTERIGEARSRVESSVTPTGAPSTARATDFEHAIMQGRARVLMDGGEVALRRHQAADASAGATPGERMAALVASATASTLLRDGARATTALAAAQALLRSAPAPDARAERALHGLRVATLQARGEVTQALGLLDQGADGSRVQVLQRAEVVLALPRGSAAEQTELRRSTEALQTWVSERRHDALAWSLLGQSAERLGLRLRAVRAQAESRAALGDFNGAIDRLRAGQRMARGGAVTPDFIEASVIDARLRDLVAQRRQLFIELNNGREPPPDWDGGPVGGR